MLDLKWIRVIFRIGALYDGLLGLVFLIAPGFAFTLHGVEPPNHMAYVQFPALLLMLFAAMFWQIGTDPVRFRHLMPYGMGLKLSYCGLAFGYQLTSGIAFMWVPWAWADLVFLVAFILAWISTRNMREPT